MNISQILWGLNAVDLLMFLVMAYVVYAGRKDGIVRGLFKLFGVLCTVFIAVHFYAGFYDFLKTAFLAKAASEFLAFNILTLASLAVFWIISKGWDLILKVAVMEALDRIGSLVLAAVQGYFICSLIFMSLLLSGSKFGSAQAQRSVSQYVIGRTAVDFYRSAHDSVIAGFFPGEKINKRALKLYGIDPEAKNKR